MGDQKMQATDLGRDGIVEMPVRKNEWNVQNAVGDVGHDLRIALNVGKGNHCGDVMQRQLMACRNKLDELADEKWI
jgi:hypothetical protein